MGSLLRADCRALYTALLDIQNGTVDLGRDMSKSKHHRNDERTLHKPVLDSRIDRMDTLLSAALSRVTLSVRDPGTDITMGTTFYTPVLTLLARGLNTRRQDVVFCAWPILGCPYHYFEQALPTVYIQNAMSRSRMDFKAVLDQHTVTHEGRPPVLWEIIDLMISTLRWNVRQLVEWVRVVEATMRRDHPGLLLQLQSMADQARKMHDENGMLTAEVGLTEGLVIPAGIRKPN